LANVASRERTGLANNALAATWPKTKPRFDRLIVNDVMVQRPGTTTNGRSSLPPFIPPPHLSKCFDARTAHSFTRSHFPFPQFLRFSSSSGLFLCLPVLGIPALTRWPVLRHWNNNRCIDYAAVQPHGVSSPTLLPSSWIRFSNAHGKVSFVVTISLFASTRDFHLR